MGDKSIIASKWLVEDAGNGNVYLKNTTVNKYLSVCRDCNGLPGFSVDVH